MTTPRVRPDSPVAKLRSVDWLLVLITLGLVGIGVAAIFSASRGEGGAADEPFKQIVFFCVGSVGAAVVAMVDYRVYRDFLGLLYMVTMTALIAVLSPLGSEVKGTKGWFQVGGFSIQPAEFAKLALIVALAATFSGRFGSVEAPRIVAALGVLSILSVFVLAEGETGSVMVYCFITLGIFTAAGVPARIILLMFASGVIVFAFAYSNGILDDYQRARVTSFFAEENTAASYQQRQSVTAIGSGGLYGQGYREGPQTQNGFVPEKSTDFIFAVIAEELGFVGGAVILGLHILLLGRILRVAQLARDGFGTFICAGIFAMISFQIFQNVAMTLRLMPITGITLPLVSYGGSSLLTTMLALGLVQSVSVHRHLGTPV